MDAAFKVPAAGKRIVTDAAVLSVVKGTLPFIFAYLQTRMESSSEELVSAGHTKPLNVSVNVSSLPPSPLTVLEGVSLLEIVSVNTSRELLLIY